MRSLRTPAAVLLAMLTAFLLCCGLTADPYYVYGMGHPDPPMQSVSLTTTSIRSYFSGAAHAMRRLPMLLTRYILRISFLPAMLCAELCVRLCNPGSRRRLMAFYLNSPKLAPPCLDM